MFRRRKCVRIVRAGLPAEDAERVCSPLWWLMRCNLAVFGPALGNVTESYISFYLSLVLSPEGGLCGAIRWLATCIMDCTRNPWTM